jgi:iron uptake system component EfeO
VNTPIKAAAALLGALALMTAATACGSDDSSSSDSGDSGVATVDVKLTDDGCDPNAITATAGPTTFSVTNDGSSAVTEFEVLQNDKILGEVENIAAGFNRDFTLTLAEGTYDTKCTNGKNEFGTLTVAAASTTATTTAGNSALAAAAVATYLQYVQQEADLLVKATEPFVAAVKAGNIDEAKALFAPAREHYESIEPIAESFGDLDPLIDAREGDVDEATWGGFHKIEQALWVNNDISQMGPVADALQANVEKLQSSIATITLEPAQIANGAVELLNEVASSKITGEEDRYSHTDLVDFAANLAGAKAAFDAVRPLLAASDLDLANTIDQRFADVQTALDAYQTPDGTSYVAYTDLTPDQTKELATQVDALAEPLSQVAATIV